VVNIVPEAPKRHLHSLNMSLDVLELLAEAGEQLSVGDVAARLGLGKATIHGVLSNLEARRYVERASGGRGGYRLGQRVWELGVVAGEFIELKNVAHQNLLALTEASGESSQFSEYAAGDVIYLDRVESPNPVRANIHVGRRAPAHAVATGKALLAFQPEAEIDRVCAGPLIAYTPNTKTDAQALRAELAEVRERGFALNPGEYRGEIIGVAAPVRDHTDAVVAAVSVSGPAYRFPIERAIALAPTIQDAAADISRRLGHQTNKKLRA
jgi:IclR family KDG regulon transcriptional repressor